MDNDSGCITIGMKIIALILNIISLVWNIVLIIWMVTHPHKLAEIWHWMWN